MAITQTDNDIPAVQSDKQAAEQAAQADYLASLPSWERELEKHRIEQDKRRIAVTREADRRKNIGYGGQVKEWIPEAIDECIDFFGTNLGEQQCYPWILEVTKVADSGDCGGWKIVGIISWQGQKTTLNRDGSFFIFLSDKYGGEIDMFSVTVFTLNTIGMGSTDSNIWQCLSRQTRQPSG